jgi:hypothetical protein
MAHRSTAGKRRAGGARIIENDGLGGILGRRPISPAGSSGAATAEQCGEPGFYPAVLNGANVITRQKLLAISNISFLMFVASRTGMTNRHHELMGT